MLQIFLATFGNGYDNVKTLPTVQMCSTEFGSLPKVINLRRVQNTPNSCRHKECEARRKRKLKLAQDGQQNFTSNAWTNKNILYISRALRILNFFFSLFAVEQVRPFFPLFFLALFSLEEKIHLPYASKAIIYGKFLRIARKIPGLYFKRM